MVSTELFAAAAHWLHAGRAAAMPAQADGAAATPAAAQADGEAAMPAGQASGAAAQANHD